MLRHAARCLAALLLLQTTVGAPIARAAGHATETTPVPAATATDKTAQVPVAAAQPTIGAQAMNAIGSADQMVADSIGSVRQEDPVLAQALSDAHRDTLSGTQRFVEAFFGNKSGCKWYDLLCKSQAVFTPASLQTAATHVEKLSSAFAASPMVGKMAAIVANATEQGQAIVDQATSGQNTVVNKLMNASSTLGGAFAQSGMAPTLGGAAGTAAFTQMMAAAPQMMAAAPQMMTGGVMG